MSPKQAVSLVVLLGASAAVWVPQFLGDNDAAPTDMSVSTDPGPIMDGELEAMPSGAEPDGMPGTVSDSTSDDSSLEEQLPDLSVLLSDTGSSSSSDLGLDSLLGSLRTFRPEGVVGVEAPVDDTVEAIHAANGAGLFEVKLAIAENPLTAILHSSSGSRAVMGGRVLSKGDELNGGVTVDRIEPQAVWLDSMAGPMEVRLPALRSRPAASERVDEVQEWRNAEEAADPEIGSNATQGVESSSAGANTNNQTAPGAGA